MASMAGENEEHVAPAEIIAEHAAGGLAEQLAEDLPGQEAAEHLLAALIGDDVADEGERERNDPAGGEPAAEPRGHQQRQRGRQPAGQHHQTSTRRRRRCAMQRYLPKRSPIGPITSCTEPCASR